MNSAIKFLKNFGLNEREIEIYSFLVANGPSKASTIAKAMKIHKMEAYRQLMNMEKRDIVKEKIQHPKLYVAVNIEKIIEFMNSDLLLKLKNLNREKNEIINDLSSKTINESYSRGEMKLIQGADRTFLAIHEMKKRTKNVLFGANTLEYYIKLLTRNNELGCEDESKQSKFKIRVIIGNPDKTVRGGREFIKRLVKSNIYQIRLTNLRIDPFPVFAVRDDEELVLIIHEGDPNKNYFDKERTALWTTNKLIITLVKTYFNLLWEKSENADSFLNQFGTGD